MQVDKEEVVAEEYLQAAAPLACACGARGELKLNPKPEGQPMRLTPAVRALRARMDRPAVRQVAIGLVLLGPLGLWVAGAPQPEGLEENRVVAEQSTATSAQDEVARAWAARELERQREDVIAQLATEFAVDTALAESIHDAAVEEQIDPKVAFGLVRAESSFRTKAVSPVGAVGLTQLMPSTARWLVPGTTRKDLMEPETNLRVGFKYLRRLIDQYEGDEKLALTAFNRGPGTVNRLLKRGRNPDNGYAEKVLTGESERHVRLMNAKFGSSSKAKGRRTRG